MFNNDDEQVTQLSGTFGESDYLILPQNNVKKKHIYLDVTSLSYDALRKAYKIILATRKKCGLVKSDLREGTTKTIDVDKALDAVYLSRIGSIKEAVTKCGFKIYRRDNPSGSYPLFRKYLKLGEELQSKLIELENFLIHIKNSKLQRSSET